MLLKRNSYNANFLNFKNIKYSDNSYDYFSVKKNIMSKRFIILNNRYLVIKFFKKECKTFDFKKCDVKYLNKSVIKFHKLFGNVKYTNILVFKNVNYINNYSHLNIFFPNSASIYYLVIDKYSINICRHDHFTLFRMEDYSKKGNLIVK